jgi:hypothetical protein
LSEGVRLACWIVGGSHKVKPKDNLLTYIIKNILNVCMSTLSSVVAKFIPGMLEDELLYGIYSLVIHN